jgi:hypothetical protein
MQPDVIRDMVYMMLFPVADEICAGRLAEAEAKSFKGAELPCSASADKEKDGNAGAPEPKQIET